MMEVEGFLVQPLHVKKRFSLWCVEMHFPVIGAVQMYTSVYAVVIFGELMTYHGVIVLPILFFISGFLNSIAGCVVNYERYLNITQSRMLMKCVAFTSFTNGLICVYYWYIYVSKEMGLRNMHSYLDKQYVKTMIDLTQQTLECCGDCGYPDWFRVDWRGTDIEPGRGYPPNERNAVPFSCCSPEAQSPCTNEYLGFDNRITLYRQGCREAMTTKGKYLALFEATVLFITGLLQVFWLANVRPPMLHIYDVENGAEMPDGDDGIGEWDEKPQDIFELGFEGPSEVKQGESTDSEQPEDSQETSWLIPPPSIPLTGYPGPESCDCLIVAEDIVMKEPSLKDEEIKRATDGIEEASSAEERDRAIDAEFDGLRSQEEALESGGEAQIASGYTTDCSSSEWIKTQLMKDLSSSDTNDEDALSCVCVEEEVVLEEKEDIMIDIAEPPPESDTAAPDSSSSELP